MKYKDKFYCLLSVPVTAIGCGQGLAQDRATQAQIDTLMQRVVALEAERNSALQPDPSSAPSATVFGPDSFPNSFMIPGTNTAIKFGGYVKLDAMKDVNGAFQGVLADFISIPVDGNPLAERDGQFTMTARQSRFNIETRTPSAYGIVKTFIEADFYGSGGSELVSNSAGLRLRQAYGEIGPVLAGQTWSNFYDIFAVPEVINFNGPVGTEQGMRQAQLRYTTAVGDSGIFSISIENPDGDVNGAVPAVFIPAGSVLSPNVLDIAPDVIARYRHIADWGHLSGQVVGRYLNIDTGGAVINGVDADAGAFAYGVGVSGRVKTFGKDNVSFQLSGGDGIGRYIQGANFFDAAAIDTNGDMQTVKSWGGNVSYQHWWNDKMRTNLVYGYYKQDDTPTLPAGSTDNLQSFYVNLIYDITPNILVGGEYVYGKRKLYSPPVEGWDNEGTASRVQAAIQITF